MAADRHSRGACSKALWTNAVFLGKEGALLGGFFGHLGALYRHSGCVYKVSCSSCMNPVVVVPRMVEMWKFQDSNRAPTVGRKNRPSQLRSNQRTLSTAPNFSMPPRLSPIWTRTTQSAAHPCRSCRRDRRVEVQDQSTQRTQDRHQSTAKYFPSYEDTRFAAKDLSSALATRGLRQGRHGNLGALIVDQCTK